MPQWREFQTKPSNIFKIGGKFLFLYVASNLATKKSDLAARLPCLFLDDGLMLSLIYLVMEIVSLKQILSLIMEQDNF